MSQQDCLRAMVYGMMAVEPGLDVLALASCGDGQQLAAAVMLAVLLRRPLPDVLLQMNLPASLEPILLPVLARIQNLPPCEVLEQCGSPAFAALVGAMLAARMARTPVLIADWGALAACAVVHRLAPDAAAHVMLAGVIAKMGWLPGHQTLDSTLSDAPGMNAALALQSLRQSLSLDTDSI
jgi:nicotinate-nucleotide--dimethylbenzimidazole phosphoribosyltransferase